MDGSSSQFLFLLANSTDERSRSFSRTVKLGVRNSDVFRLVVVNQPRLRGKFKSMSDGGPMVLEEEIDVELFEYEIFSGNSTHESKIYVVICLLSFIRHYIAHRLCFRPYSMELENRSRRSFRMAVKSDRRETTATKNEEHQRNFQIWLF